ncbi:hypothetical protein MTO96_027015 [Rhipicephalus appendiculatus]
MSSGAQQLWRIPSAAPSPLAEHSDEVSCFRHTVSYATPCRCCAFGAPGQVGPALLRRWESRVRGVVSL